MSKKIVTKKLLIVLISSLLACLGIVFAVFTIRPKQIFASGSGSWNGGTWTLTDAGKLTISGSGEMTNCPWNTDEYRASIKNVVIESGVTTICADAFKNCTNMTALSMPNTLHTIGSSALARTKLRDLYLPSSVTTIVGDGRCFYITSGYLVTITVDVSNPVFKSEGNCLLKRQDNGKYTLVLGCIKSVIPTDGSIEKIGLYSFNDIYAMNSFEIPDSVIEIGDYAFYECVNLSSIKIGENVTSIGFRAFSQCTRLKSITITSKVDAIGNEAFHAQENVTFEGSLPTNIGSNLFVVAVKNTLQINVPYEYLDDYKTAFGKYVNDADTQIVAIMPVEVGVFVDFVAPLLLVMLASLSVCLVAYFKKHKNHFVIIK